MSVASDLERIAQASSSSLSGPVVVFEWLADSGWPVVYASPNAYEVLGYRARDFMGGMVYEDIIHEEDRARIRREVAEHVRRGDTHGVHYHYRAVRADGVVIFVEEVNRIVRDEQGRALRYIGHVIDVTERRRAEARLRQRESALEEALAIAQFGYWVWDLRTREVAWSDQMYTIFGVDPRRVEPTWATMLEIVHPGDLEGLQVAFAHAYGEFKPWNHIFRVVRPSDGDLRYIRGRGRTVFEHGEPVRVVGTVQDLTEYVRAEEILQSRRFWLETLIDALPVMVCFKDHQGRWTVANENFLRFFELDGVDYQGKTDEEISAFSENHVGALLQCAQVDELVWELGRTHDVEEKVCTDDGLRERVLDVTKVPLFEPDGARKGMVIVARDVTEEHRTQKALRTSRARLAEAQRIAQMGSWEYHEQTRQFIWSQETFRIFGLEPSRQAVSVEEIEPFIVGGMRSLSEAIARTLYEGREFEFDHEIETAKGKPKIIHASGHVVQGVGEGSSVIHGVVQDVTEVRRAASLKRRLGRLLDESSNEILVFDAETLRCVQANQGARENLGYGEEEILGMTLVDLSPALGTREKFEALVRPLREGARELISYESEHRRRDGSSYPVEVRLHLSAYEAPPVFLSIVQDITERRHVERLKEEFVSVVSHELRTPLTPISGVLSMLASGRGGELPASTQKMVDLAQRNSKRLLYLIDDLLDLRKLSSEGLEFRMREVDVGEAVAEVVRINETVGAELGVKFVLDVVDPGLVVRADEDRLAQIVTNLIVNAGKFSPEGSVVVIRAEREGGCARVSVTDEGPGIPRDFRPRVFDKFAQADSSSTRRHGGTGLGLAISKAIVEKMHGRIAFETEVGEGSVFYFELPLLHAVE